ncbi:MAG: type IX secretion system sortase PorU [Bacteroidota bacterium]
MNKLAIILFLLLPAVMQGQTESVVIKWNDSHGRLSFLHALYEDGQNTLPYFSKKIAWDHEGMIPVAYLDVNKTSPVEPGELSGISTLHLENQPLIEYSLVREARQSFVMIRILPFIRNGSGGVERVDDFTIRIEQKMAIAPLKIFKADSWSGNSVLADGAWYRVSVKQSGMHKLTYEQLQEMGMQNPASVRVYGTGARPLSERYSLGHVDDLSPLPVQMEKGGDGMFGPGDHILFYAEGPVSWQYSEEESLFLHNLHHYSHQGYYFLTDSKGASVAPGEATLSSEAATHTVTGYDYRVHFEEERYNLINSGKEWYGDEFSVNLENHYPFKIPGRIAGEPVKIGVTVAARSGQTTDFQVGVNNQQLGSISINSTDLSHYTSTYAYESRETFETTPGQGDITVTLEYNRPDSDSKGWLNHMTLNGRCNLSMEAMDELSFRESRSAGPGNVSHFQLGQGGETEIWDVTDPSSPLRIPATQSGGDALFTLATNQIREFVAFRPGGDFPTPGYSGEGVGVVDNQDLHGLQHPDMVIVTPEIFLEQATKLASHRERHDQLEVAVVLQQQVFNEFSSGTPDVTAIRNFMKMFYDRSGGVSSYCRYLLLFGDGTFANRTDPEKPGNPNLILTYQSNNSLAPTRSFVSDDFFGFLDTDESLASGLLDIGIGRLPVSTVDEAELVVEKIIAYDSLISQGSWRNQLCFIGDDEDSNIHMRQSDELARYVNDRYPAYNLNKIFLDAYPQEKSATGFRYPDVVRAINDQVNRGALIVNYTGHGGPAGLAHEQVVTINDINSWSNGEMLPLFMTATCEFSRYDEYDPVMDAEKTSAGEQVLLNPQGGGIGLFTTTRLVYSGPNHVLNERFYEVVFEKDENLQNYRLGDIIAYSKNNTGAGINKLNFTLLGDPSMRLSYPEHRVVTDSLNGTDIQLLEDTLSAFDWVTVSGHLETEEGAALEQFNGTVYPKVFDKERLVETLSNDDTPQWSFKSRNSILYSGKATVTNGKFSFKFYVPKDINYAYGPGKISYYSNDSLVDAHGSYEGFNVGGIGTENAIDLEPPVVELFMNDSFFLPGGITDAHPSLLVYARDNYGINTTGNGIGHDLTAILDGNRVGGIILNDLFQSNTNSYNSGTILYPYSNLEEGTHEITVKIWDIHNNSTEERIRFLVIESEEMLLEELFNYPNPFFDQTLFSIEHNRPDQNMKVVVTIHNLSGEVVRIIERDVYSAGYRLEPLPWDGTSSGGAKLGGGIYIYRATLSTEEGEVATNSGKLILLD